MTRRVFWFVTGALAALVGASATKRKVRSVAADLAPAQLARRAAGRVRGAFAEGRQAMHDKERELQHARDRPGAPR